MQSIDSADPISCRLQSAFRQFRNGEQFKTDYLSTWRWAKAGTKERVRSGDPTIRDEEGAPSKLIDVFVEGTTMNVLYNWDPARPTAGPRGRPRKESCPLFFF